MSTLFSEFKRRNVFRVAVLYLVSAWLIAQVADVVIGLGELPPSIGRVILVILALGFPVTLVLSWFFEWSPQGIRLESEAAAAEPGAQPAGRRLDVIIIGLLSVALVYFVINHDWRGVPGVSGASVAVLPFENRSAQADDLYFTDGIHEDILTQLGKISSMVVISRTSVMQYRDSVMTIPEIAEELGVATILEGGVQRVGNRVRINMQLIDAASDKHLWAETWDRELSADNVFAIQSEIATSIASALHARLLPQEQARIEALPTHNLDAYDSYLLGRRQLASRDIPDLRQARDHFRRAIERDPEFALAYTGLADTLVLLSLFGDGDAASLLAEAETAARRALELNPDQGEAHTSLGVVLQYRGEPAEEYAPLLKRAVELAPGSADARKWYSGHLTETGRDEEALAHLQKAAQLDPLSPIVRVNLAGGLQKFGRHDEALAHLRRALEIDPRFMPALLSISDLTRTYEALALLSIPYRADRDNLTAVMAFVQTYLLLGDDDRAAQWTAEMDRIAPDAWQSLVAHLNLSLYRVATSESVKYANRLLPMEDGFITVPSRTLMLHDLDSGDTAAALDRYQEKYPELLGDDPPVARSLSAATEVGMLMLALGEVEKANRLFDRGLDYIGTLPSGDVREYGVFKARIHALRGERDEALAALRQAIDAGWRFQWWWFMAQDPAFESVRDDLRFQQMWEERRARFRSELEAVRQLEAKGEIALPPSS